MRIFKLIRYDIKNGFWQSKWRLLSLIILVAFSCMDFYIRKNNVYFFEAVIPQGTFGDYMCYLFGGIPEYHPKTDEEFIFPIKWFLFHLVLLYGTLHYSIRDLYSVGNIILPRSTQRSAWWFSKCLWNALYVITAYAVVFVTILGFCMITGEQIALPVTGEFMNLLMEADSSFSKFPIQFSVMMLFLPCLLSIGNSLILLVLTLFLKPVLSYGIMIIFLLCGAYFNSMFWWESLTMSLRSEWVVQGGYTMFHAAILGGVVIIGAWIVGGIYFQKYDILNLDSE